ncbi:glycine--tRNA ligase subunit beta [Thiolapillus brandeum]|uniref:Glycine--tRNA ligase beta subunit n=1 Tax=Thiolapillus brandeum TaxID=1076588 RepID=A0A7U6GG24_9GAMM|nr:glycine--tRNA ligase subunit beta [Thiolapillus brandeum]BAO42959.1 glycyl-tRNA synthetase beta chain [Thiolapillus brandeum]
MNASQDMIFELGTEELPPVALKKLSSALEKEFLAGLKSAGLTHGKATSYAAPRRLALLVENLATRQPDRNLEKRGPAVQAAFDAEGNPSKAAEGFARSCGTRVDQLSRLKTDKGEWLAYRIEEKGRAAAELLPEIAETALARLPIPKRMRWGRSEAQFVRPVHWLLFVHGEQTIPCTLLDAPSGSMSYGHRFHHPDAININIPSEYADKLVDEGKVIAHFGTRRENIRSQVEKVAETLGGRADIDDALLDEVTALNEWPVAITGSFEKRFLEVPAEALILTMKKNQKYFPLFDSDGRLMNHFITIANIDSPRPEVIAEGNERVIRPRLADAMFFWEQDGKQKLENHIESLKSVVFQKDLGSMFDKTRRVAALSRWIAEQTGADQSLAERAAMLSRCDLMTNMVGEFADMQGIMGRYQALRDGEPEAVAVALEEFYLPRYSGDRLPTTPTGITLAVAEKTDTLMGIFGIGMKPTGDKDPFALRRAALGLLRILREHSLTVSLDELLEQAEAALGAQIKEADARDQVKHFLMDRLKVLLADEGIGSQLFEAVAAVNPTTVPDLEARIQAVRSFQKLVEAESLAAANKRIRNILKKSNDSIPQEVDTALLREPAEKELFRTLQSLEQKVSPLVSQGEYTQALKTLSELREPVDRFFDDVMVNVDDPSLRVNRLALLQNLAGLFLQVADISLLQ